MKVDITTTIKNQIKTDVEVSINQPNGIIEITKNGIHDIKKYKTAKVDVKGINPTGSLEVTENGSYDVTEKESVNVNVEKGVFPTGTLEITENGEYDVIDKAYVEVNVEGSGGGTDYLGLRLEQTENYEYSNDKVTTLPQYFFYNDKKIQKASFPNVTKIETKCFENSSIKELYAPSVVNITGSPFMNSELEKISLPNLISVGSQTFENCQKLRSANLPNATGSDYYLFRNCYVLESAYVPKLTSIQSYSFNGCASLKALILGGTSVISLSKTTAFSGASHIQGAVNETYNPSGAQDGYIYVPDNLVASYKSATNWSIFSSQIKGLSELPQEYKDLYGIA